MKIIFICYGNICRSVMAEYIFKSLMKENEYIVTSAAISSEEYSHDIYHKAKNILDKNNIKYDKHFAHKITKEEYEENDLIIVMEEYQINELYDMYGKSNKVKMLTDKNIEDPWYTNNFDKVYKEIYNGCLELYNKLKNE